MSRTFWTRVAQADLDQIIDTYLDLGTDHGLRVAELALAAGRFLGENPHAGEQVDTMVRKWRVGGTDFILLYRIALGRVEVLRVHQARQDWRRTP